MMRNENTPNERVNIPSCELSASVTLNVRYTNLITRINIHAHPGRPASPSIFDIAAARRPEKAPDKEAAAKNVEILIRSYDL